MVFEGVEAMPVEEGPGEELSPAAEAPDLVAEEPRVEEAEEDYTCQECVEPRILPDPGQPTQKQLEDHRIDHLPYRSWCPWCVAARATGEQHRKRLEEKRISTFSMDYLFLTKSRVVDRESLLEGEEVELKVLVAKDSKTKTVFAHAVPCKGSDDDGYAIARVTEDIAWLGHQRLILKADNEPAILKLLKDSLKTARVEVEDLEQVMDEQAVKYDSKSNGDAENAVKQVTKQLRTLKLCLEQRISKKIPTAHPVMTWLVEHAAWVLNTRIAGEDGITAYHRTKGKSYAKRSVAFGEYVMYMLPTKGPQHNEMGKLDARWKHGYIMGYGKSSNEYYIFEEEAKKLTLARSVQRVPLDSRWKAQGLESMHIPCQQLYGRKAARGVQVEEFRDDPNAKDHEKARVRIQRVWIYERDYKMFGITDDCKKCLHNQRLGYNKSKMIHSEKCRKRMEEALATTEEGRRRLEEAEERANQRLAKEVEESDVRPERGIEVSGPDGGWEDDLFGNPLTQPSDNATPGMGLPAVDLSTQGGARRQAAEKPQGPRGLNEASTRYSGTAVERTSIDDWIEGEDMDLENGDQVPQTPHLDDDYEPTTPRGSDSDVEMDMGMIELLKTCSGSEEIRKEAQSHSDEIMKIVRDLGGSRKAYQKERTKALKGIVSEIYSPPRVTRPSR